MKMKLVRVKAAEQLLNVNCFLKCCVPKSRMNSEGQYFKGLLHPPNDYFNYSLHAMLNLLRTAFVHAFSERRIQKQQALLLNGSHW